MTIEDKDNCNPIMLSKFTKSELITEVVRLQDEVDSLWHMVDEMKASDIKHYRKELSTTVEQKLKEMRAMLNPPVTATPVTKKK
jgi:hypothetical protein